MEPSDGLTDGPAMWLHESDSDDDWLSDLTEEEGDALLAVVMLLKKGCNLVRDLGHLPACLAPRVCQQLRQSAPIPIERRH